MRAPGSMDRIARWAQITTGAALLTVAVALAPAVLIGADGAPVTAYYTAGGLGLWSAAALALVTALVAWAVVHGTSDPATAVGATVALAVATLVSTLVWAGGVSETLVFSFPATASWIELHRPGMLAAVLVLAGAAARLSALIITSGR